MRKNDTRQCPRSRKSKGKENWKETPLRPPNKEVAVDPNGTQIQGEREGNEKKPPPQRGKTEESLERKKNKAPEHGRALVKNHHILRKPRHGNERKERRAT